LSLTLFFLVAANTTNPIKFYVLFQLIAAAPPTISDSSWVIAA